MLTRLTVGILRVYQRFISPLFPPACKYHPTCSAYAVEAFETHGFFRGFGMSVWRVLRCNPFSAGGVDPVPPQCGEKMRPRPLEDK